MTEVPQWVRDALRPDESPYYDPLARVWFGVRDNDPEDWRNVRELAALAAAAPTKARKRKPRNG